MRPSHPPRHDPDGGGGAAPVIERPPDRPGPARGPTLALVAFLALLTLAMPVAWGAGALTGARRALGTPALVLLWVLWIAILLAFLGTARALWRRAA